MFEIKKGFDKNIKDCGNEPRFLHLQRLFELLVEFTKSEDYQYLKDWGNHTKHWSNVSSQHSYNLTEEKNLLKWYFPSFSYDGRGHKNLNAIEFVNREFDRQSKLLPEIIKEIDISCK